MIVIYIWKEAPNLSTQTLHNHIFFSIHISTLKSIHKKISCQEQTKGICCCCCCFFVSPFKSNIISLILLSIIHEINRFNQKTNKNVHIIIIKQRSAISGIITVIESLLSDFCLAPKYHTFSSR